MLAHRLRRWANIKSIFLQRLVFAGLGHGDLAAPLTSAPWLNRFIE